MIFEAAMAAQAAGQTGLSKIEHIVIVVQENRSFDDLFRGFPNAHSASRGKLLNGTTVALKPVSLAAAYDISHSLQDAKTAYDDGRMDGFANEYSSGEKPYSQYAYVPRSEVTPYWSMAQQYVLGDQMFASQLDASFVAHQYLIAGWAGNTYNYPAVEPWGCDSPSSNAVGLLNGIGQPFGLTYPCFSYSTIADKLDAKKISWRYYAPKTGVGYSWTAFDAISHVRKGPDWKNVVSPETRVLSDVAKGELADVTWVVPSLPLSDHAGSLSKRGPSWVASVVNAIGKSKFWSSTAVFVVWDDWGGWYDDVAPPQLDYDGLGIRVPFICISPYAKSGYVDDTPCEFGSLLKFIEDRYALGTLGRSDARATAPLRCFDFAQKARAFAQIDAPYDPAAIVRSATSEAPDEQNSARRGEHVVALMALAACTAHDGGATPPGSLLPPAMLRANAGVALLYVSDPVGNDVAVYHAGGSKQSPIATITQGIAGPAGLTVDAKGDLFVTNTAGNSVTEYAPNGTSPEATYSQSVLGPVDVAVDGAGTLYVANSYSFVASVVEFPSGSQKPSLTIANPCSCYPVGLTLDAKGSLYVAYDDYYEQTLVFEYAPGSTKGTSLGLQFNQQRWEAAGLTFDKSANLLVADATLPGVQIYPAGKESPSKILGKRGAPRFVALDSTQTSLFVTDTTANAVEEYAYPSGRLTNVITNGLKSVYGVALSPAG